MAAPWRLGAAEALRALAAGACTSEELVSACLARIVATDEALHAFITVAGEDALAAARASDQRRRSGSPPGRLEGLPVAIKNLTRTRGLRTTFGSLAFADNVPDEDEICVARLRAAGAVIIGKTSTPNSASVRAASTRCAARPPIPTTAA